MASVTYFAITPTTSPEAMALLQTLVGSGALQQVVPAPGAAPVPTTPLAQAEDVIAAIPVAEDGTVIRANYHNSLRNALIALLAEVGVGRGPIAPLSPALLPVDSAPGWTVSPGTAALQAPKTGPDASASGWLPVELPHGGKISNLTVTGRRVGAIGSFLVTLSRQALTSDEQPPINLIAAMQLKGANATFVEVAEAGAPDSPNAGPAEIAERRTIDNTKFKYFVRADVTSAKNDSRAQINSIQVVVMRV